LGDSFWRAIFAINLPLGSAAIYLLLAKVPADRPTERGRLGLGGAAIATAALGSFAFGLTVLSTDHAASAAGLATVFVAAGLVLSVAFLLWERRQSEPMVDLSLFRIK